MEAVIAPKILLIEDDPMIQEMYKFRLEAEHYQVIVTEQGSQALELAVSEQPAVILLDVILPEIDGFTILEMLKSRPETQSIPVLLLTNLGQESDRERGQTLGASDYFVKAEHTPSDVIRKIQELMVTT